jgi:hypothetical protein
LISLDYIRKWLESSLSEMSFYQIRSARIGIEDTKKVLRHATELQGVLETDIALYNELITFHQQLIVDIKRDFSEEEFWKKGSGSREHRTMASIHGIVGAKYREKLNQWVHRLVYRRDSWTNLLVRTERAKREIEGELCRRESTLKKLVGQQSTGTYDNPITFSE